MKKIIIKLGNGDLADGFSSVNIELKTTERTRWQDNCSLQPAPALNSSLTQWKLLYKEIVRLNRDRMHRGVNFDDQAITNVSIQDLRNLHDRLKIELNKWLSESDFSRLERSLRTKLSDTEEITVIIQASQQSIWQLPWYLWDFFTAYPFAVEVFSNPENTDVSNPLIQPNGKVDILALFGTDPLLNFDRDFQCLQSLPDVNLTIFETTSAQAIVDRLNLDSLDILYLSGHGESVEYASDLEGVIYLNAQISIEISTLESEIKQAVNRGLKVAIFNCCSGLGIVQQLRDTNLTYLIVMRAEIPNQIAQNFLEHLLAEYSNGADFTRAFQLARKSISTSTESWLKFANWLPVMFHNPLSHSVSWQDFIGAKQSESTPKFSLPKSRLWTSLGLSLVLAGLSMGLKSTEPIQQVENLAIDLLSQLQSPQNENMIVLKPPLTILGKLNNPQTLTTAIAQIDRHAQPQAFLIDNSLKQHLPNTSTEPQWVLNSRLFDRLESMTIESVSALSPQQLQDIFNHKIIIVIERNPSIEQSLIANRTDLTLHPHLLKIRSKPEEFMWIFGWCNISIVAVWTISKKLFIPTTIAVFGSQIILGGVMVIMGHSTPIAIASIAIISAGMIVFNLIEN